MFSSVPGGNGEFVLMKSPFTEQLVDIPLCTALFARNSISQRFLNLFCRRVLLIFSPLAWTYNRAVSFTKVPSRLHYAFPCLMERTLTACFFSVIPFIINPKAVRYSTVRISLFLSISWERNFNCFTSGFGGVLSNGTMAHG